MMFFLVLYGILYGNVYHALWCYVPCLLMLHWLRGDGCSALSNTDIHYVSSRMPNAEVAIITLIYLLICEEIFLSQKVKKITHYKGIIQKGWTCNEKVLRG